MRPFILACLLVLASNFSLQAGGPSVEIIGNVNGIQTGDDYITFAIYGKARLFVYEVTWDDAFNGTEAKWVPFKFENRFLVIHKDNNPVPGFSQDWNELVKEALSLKDKKIFVQCWGTKAVVEGPSISRIDAESAKFHEQK